MIPTYRKSDHKIDYLIKKFRDPAFDDYARSHIANYTCVLISGLIESAIREIISAYCNRKAAPLVSNFAGSRLERFQNPDPESVLQLLASFDQALADRIDAQWAGEIKDALGSVVGNRHLIAHGRDTSLTLVRVSEWFQAARRFIRMLEEEFVDQLDRKIP